MWAFNLLIYLDFVTDFRFCNSGQRRPPCRMTRWMDDNEFKDPKFCQFHQLPGLFVFFLKNLFGDKWSFCAKQSGVAESIGESMMDSATPDENVLRAE